jgi:hypothetical protein
LLIKYIDKGFTEKNNDSKIIKTRFLLVLLISIGLLTACGSTGTPKLSENNIKNIVEGNSSKDDVFMIIGPPEHTLALNRNSLDTYLHRVISKKASAHIFEEGQYEVWIYNKWRYFAVDPLLIPSQESSHFGLFIFNGSGVCIKKFYAEAEHM